MKSSGGCVAALRGTASQNRRISAPKIEVENEGDVSQQALASTKTGSTGTHCQLQGAVADRHPARQPARGPHACCLVPVHLLERHGCGWVLLRHGKQREKAPMRGSVSKIDPPPRLCMEKKETSGEHRRTETRTLLSPMKIQTCAGAVGQGGRASGGARSARSISQHQRKATCGPCHTTSP